MKSQPLVTVITSYYNRQEGLKESVLSILSQTYQNFEYIVIDDCSTDSTYEALKSFSDSRLCLIRNERNLGLTRSLINAIAVSNGEYIAVHGAGDISHAKRIQMQVDLFRKDRSLGMVGCKVNNVDFYTKKLEEHPALSPAGEYRFTHGEVMFRRDIYELVGGYYSWCVFGQFSGLKYRFAKCSNLGLVNEFLYKRMYFNEGVSQTSSKVFLQGYYINVSKQLSLISGTDVCEERYLPYVNQKEAVVSALYAAIKTFGFIEMNSNQCSIIRNNSIALYIFSKIFFCFREFSSVNKYIVFGLLALFARKEAMLKIKRDKKL